MKNLFTNVGRGLALTTLLTAGTLATHAQNVGIGTTAPDVSAALDIVSTSKGALLPRVASVAGVPTPATGLIVYQTGGTPGYYYNSGTPGAPNWQQFATAAGAAVTASNGLTKTGSNIVLGGTLTGATTIAQGGNNFSLTGGNVGIGTTAPSQALDVANGGIAARANNPIGNQGAHLQWNRSGFEGETWLLNQLGGGTANAGIRFGSATTANAVTEWARFINNGFFGLGTTTPRAPLDFGSGFGATPSDPIAKKLALYTDGSFNFYGLGVSASQLNLYASAAANGAPVMGLSASGNVGIGLGNAAPTAKLEVAGGSVKISTLGQGLIFPDGTTQTTAAVSAATITASNGLTKTGNDIALGGTLLGATTIAQGGNNFSLTGGRVGIGTAAPNSLLDLGESFGATPTDPIAKKLAVYNNGSGTNFYGLGVAASELDFFAAATPTAAPGMVLRAVSGNVGIGTSTPSQKFEVATGGIRAGAFGAFSGAAAIDQGAHLQWNRSTGDGETWLINHIGLGTANAGIRFAGITTATGITPTEWARFLNNGFFGIGTTSPRSLLDLGSGFGATPSDPATKKLAVYSNGSGTDFYGLGVSSSQLNLFAGATSTGAPVVVVNAGGSVGIGLGNGAPTQRLDVLGGIRAGANGAFSGVTLADQGAHLQWNRTGSDGETYLINHQGFGGANAGIRFGGITTTTGTAPTEWARFINNGNFGIGTAAPAYKLEVAGDINAIGQVRANGVVLTSDARFKQQVRPLGGALAAVQALRGVRYTWNALGIKHGGQAGTEQVGVLAQELEKVFPELVSTGADGYKAVNYAQLTPVLIEAIKEQQQQIEALKAQNAALLGRTAQADADHASLQTLQAQMARLLGETAPAGAQARK